MIERRGQPTDVCAHTSGERIIETVSTCSCCGDVLRTTRKLRPAARLAPLRLDARLSRRARLRRLKGGGLDD